MAKSSAPLWLGVISDTHGLLRPQALDALRGSSHIIHAGDVGDPEILRRLGELAPVTAVRGNVDTAPWARGLPLSDVVEIGGHFIYVLHQRDQLDIDPGAGGMSAVVYGHSHRPEIDTRDGILYLNPGSAGPRRFTLPMTVARVRVTPEALEPAIVELPV